MEEVNTHANPKGTKRNLASPGKKREGEGAEMGKGTRLFGNFW